MNEGKKVQICLKMGEEKTESQGFFSLLYIYTYSIIHINMGIYTYAMRTNIYRYANKYANKHTIM